jgi:hypothetical protein
MQKKKSTKIHKMLRLAYVKKKQRLTEKNHTWCELGHDSSSGVKEGGTGLLDLDSGDRMHKKRKTNHPCAKSQNTHYT